VEALNLNAFEQSDVRPSRNEAEAHLMGLAGRISPDE